jgi:hypothetical protein
LARLVTFKEPIQKNVKGTFTLLKHIVAGKTVLINKSGDPLDKVLARMSKSEGQGFLLKYQDSIPGSWGKDSITNLILETSNYDISVDYIYIDQKNNSDVTGIIETFSSSGFPKSTKSRFRLVIEMKEQITFRFYIDILNYRTHNHNSTQCLRITLKSMILDIYIYKTRDNMSFLICDSENITEFETFAHCCNSCLISLGYITGHLIQSEGFYFTYTDDELAKPKEFHFQLFRKSLSTIFSPVYANAHGYIRDTKEADKIQQTLRTLTLSEFSTLCQWAVDSIELTAILLLISEACGSSLAIMPSAFSVALESLTELIISETAESFSPITDKLLARELKRKLKTELDTFKEKLSAKSTVILKERINNINQITNQSKLMKPFEILNFNLSAEDIIAINHRNNFLHGKIAYLPDKKNKKKEVTLQVSGQEIYYTALRLYTLLSVLILKSVKYDNKILNHPKIQSHNYNDVFPWLKDEPYFRQL